MQEDKMREMKKVIDSLRTNKAELISSYQEGYIGKKVYRVTLNDGSTRICEQITKNKDKGDAVVIIPITRDGNFVMIVESRPNTKETVAIEFPAGMVDGLENPDEAAKRELLEETGYVADAIYKIEWHYQDQGCSPAIIRIYVAEGCHKVQEQNLDEGEKLKPIEMTYSDILKLIREDNLVNDANTKLGFMSYIMKKKGLL